MADTKVSGLTAAASFLSTHEFPVNEAGTSKKVTGAQIQATMANGAQANYTQVTANQTPITTVVDLTGLTLAVTPIASRRLKITGYALFTSSVSTDSVQLSVQEGATILAQAVGGVSADYVTLQAVAVIAPTAALHTYKLTAQRHAGSGNVTMAAGATFPAFLLIEDIGT